MPTIEYSRPERIAVMPHFTVYKIEMPNGSIEYKSFDKGWLDGPIPANCDFGIVFLPPLNAKKYYQLIEAENHEAAIMKVILYLTDLRKGEHDATEGSILL